MTSGNQRDVAAAPAGTKWAEVDISALRDNAASLRRWAGDGCAVMAMVKANGYGHGAVNAARAALAGGATWSRRVIHQGGPRTAHWRDRRADPQLWVDDAVGDAGGQRHER